MFLRRIVMRIHMRFFVCVHNEDRLILQQFASGCAANAS